MTKKILLVLLIVFFLAGCGANYGKKASYKNWSHWAYSWWRYKQPVNEETVKRSQAEEWWGKRVIAPGEVEEK